MTISRAHVSTHRGDVIYLEAVRWPVNCFTRSRTTFNLILLLVWEHRKTDNAHILDINVLINWQLSKQSTRWPVSLDRIAGSGVDPSRSSIFWSYPLTSKLVFKWSQAQVQFFFLIHMKYVVFMCCTIKILIANWPRTWKFSQLLQAGKTVAFVFSHNGHALVTLYVQFLCSDWSKFDRWVHAQNLCSILNLVYFNSWSWQSFVSTCDVFNCLFPLDVQNEIQLLSGVFCYSWLVCLLGFWLRKRRLSKSEIRFRMASFSFSPCLMRKRIAKSEAILAFLDTFQELHLEW